MIPLAVPDLSGNEEKYLTDCIKTNFVSSVGPYVDQFEKKCAALVRSESAAAVSSGTCALHLSLMISGVQTNDLVITPAFTFIATVNAISHCGAMPLLVDISKESWTISIPHLTELLSINCEFKNGNTYYKKTGQKVSAIIPVYVLGVPAEMDEILLLAQKYNLKVIADAACALGSKYKNKNLGEICDLSIVSFNGNKIATSGGGGLIFGKNKSLVAKAKHISSTAKVGNDYDFDEVGYNYRMTNIQAAIGLAQVEKIDIFIRKKRDIRKHYNSGLKNIESISFFPDPSWVENNYWLSGIVLKNKDKVKELISFLNSKQIVAKNFWKPIHYQKPYLNSLQTNLDFTDSLWERIVTLPCSTSITEAELQFTTDAILEFFN